MRLVAGAWLGLFFGGCSEAEDAPGKAAAKTQPLPVATAERVSVVDANALGGKVKGGEVHAIPISPTGARAYPVAEVVSEAHRGRRPAKFARKRSSSKPIPIELDKARLLFQALMYEEVNPLGVLGEYFKKTDPALAEKQMVHILKYLLPVDALLWRAIHLMLTQTDDPSKAALLTVYAWQTDTNQLAKAVARTIAIRVMGGVDDGEILKIFLSLHSLVDTANLSDKEALVLTLNGGKAPAVDPAVVEPLISEIVAEQAGVNGALCGLFVPPNNAVGVQLWDMRSGKDILDCELEAGELTEDMVHAFVELFPRVE